MFERRTPRHLGCAMVAACAGALFAAGTARAEAPSPPSMRPSAFQLELTPQVGFIRNAPAPGPGVALGAFGAIGERWSLGVSAEAALFVFAYSMADGEVPAPVRPQPTNTFGRLDGELRFHPALTTRIDAWVGGAAGAGVTSFGTGSAPAHFGPHLGAGAGLDLHPIAALSVGMVARGGALLVSVPQSGATVFPQASLGLVLGFHVPSDPSDPPKRAAQADPTTRAF
jgi:hypothetical protein